MIVIFLIKDGSNHSLCRDLINDRAKAGVDDLNDAEKGENGKRAGFVRRSCRSHYAQHHSCQMPSNSIRSSLKHLHLCVTQGNDCKIRIPHFYCFIGHSPDGREKRIKNYPC